jgi:hypothetical protein
MSCTSNLPEYDRGSERDSQFVQVVLQIGEGAVGAERVGVLQLFLAGAAG